MAATRAHAAEADSTAKVERKFVQDIAWSPDGSKIAYSVASGGWDHGGEYDIWVMRADGSHKSRLTREPGPDLWAAWSPNGKRLAFMSKRTNKSEIFVMTADGKQVASIMKPGETGSQPSWSPDGELLAFTRQEDEKSQIMVMHADGSQSSRVSDGAANDTNPAWSASGTHLLFYSDREGKGKDQVYVMRSNGSDLTRVTDGTGNNIFPGWGPDGQHIVFASDRPDTTVRALSPDMIDNAGLFVISADGSGLSPLKASGFLARFSPDGKQLAFINGKWPASAIFVADADGSHIRRIGP